LSIPHHESPKRLPSMSQTKPGEDLGNNFVFWRSRNFNNNKMIRLILFDLALCLCVACDESHTVSPAADKTDTGRSGAKGKPGIDINALTASPANFKLLLDNQYVRVLEYSLNPGEKDQWHTHPAKSSYVVSGGQLKVHLANGDTIMANEKTGTASWMDHVGKHYVENVGKTPVVIVLTEIKSLEKK
jgi:beta-alanine degradation protein BauB